MEVVQEVASQLSRASKFETMVQLKKSTKAVMQLKKDGLVELVARKLEGLESPENRTTNLFLTKRTRF